MKECILYMLAGHALTSTVGENDLLSHNIAYTGFIRIVPKQLILRYSKGHNLSLLTIDLEQECS